MLLKFTYRFSPNIKFSILIRSMVPPKSEEGWGGICPKCPILDPPLHYMVNSHALQAQYHARILFQTFLTCLVDIVVYDDETSTVRSYTVQ